MRQPQQPPQEEGFFTRAKRSVKGFFSGAAKSLPMTMLYSGATLVGSAALGTLVSPELDLLRVAGSTGNEFATRLLGGTIIGTVINGTIGGVQAFNTPAETSAPAGGQQQQRSTTPVRQRSVSSGMDDVVVPFTPNNRAEVRAK